MYEFRGATLQDAVHQALRYPGYTHQNTANEESAADGHTAFATFVFSG